MVDHVTSIEKERSTWVLREWQGILFILYFSLSHISLLNLSLSLYLNPITYGSYRRFMIESISWSSLLHFWFESSFKQAVKTEKVFEFF